MGERRERFLELLTSTTDREGFDTLIPEIGNLLGVDHAMYHLIGQSGDQIATGTYATSWQDHYISTNLFRADPVVRSCFNAAGPVRWERLDWTTPGAKRLMGDASDAGVGNQGISIPIRNDNGDFSVLTISHSASEAEWEKKSRDIGGDFFFFAHLANEKGRDLINSDKKKSKASLSPREIDVLSLLAVGLTRTQAADYLGLSEHTVRVYIESARKKVGAANTLHAVARAQLLGLIAA